MNIERKEAPPESARELFYKGECGNWYWVNEYKRKHKGKPIGYSEAKSSDYRSFMIDGVRYYAHRVVYWLETGEWPEYVDHIDRNPRNTHPSNLRAASSVVNARNATRPLRAVGTGHKRKDGAHSYRVHIYENDKPVYVGTFYTEAEAIFATKFARSAVYGQDTNPSLYSERQVTEMYLLMESGVSMLDVIKQYEPSLLFANQC